MSIPDEAKEAIARAESLLYAAMYVPRKVTFDIEETKRRRDGCSAG